MLAPYGLNILDNCMTCPVRGQHLFCNLPSSAAEKLNDITSSAVYPRNAILFIEGQQARGVFVLCTGRAKLSIASREGKSIITKLCEHGDVLGLSATIYNCPYEVTAEMIEPGQANFITSDALLTFLHDYGEVALRIAQQLSRNYYSAHEEIRTLGLTPSPAQRFAKLLLAWSVEWAANSSDSGLLRLTLTHEEIGEMIGTTRETVTRLFADFRRKQLIDSKGSTVVIRNQPALEGMARV